MPQFLVDPRDVSLDSREAILRGSEAHHLLRVFRARVGETVDLFDGRGCRWRGRVVGVHGDEARIEGLEPLASNEPSTEAILVQGLLKGERWDWLIAKATELGVGAIFPVRGRRSVPALKGEKAGARVARWSAIALAAAKQCERARPPAVADPRELPELLSDLREAEPDEARLVFAERIAQASPPRPRPVRRVYLAVGPEGGWAREELEAFERAGFSKATLGPRILRAETAALAAAVLAQALWGDLVTTPHP
jgi:16S rRNA (uracil1498-N3)-methyltransferase